MMTISREYIIGNHEKHSNSVTKSRYIEGVQSMKWHPLGQSVELSGGVSCKELMSCKAFSSHSKIITHQELATAKKQRERKVPWGSTQKTTTNV